jgi:hypothetical protein
MTFDEIHALLLTRFRNDAVTLRDRAGASGGVGPSPARSLEMAAACDAIAALIADAPATEEALRALHQQLAARAAAAPAATQPVWRGAALRTTELLALHAA